MAPKPFLPAPRLGRGFASCESGDRFGGEQSGWDNDTTGPGGRGFAWFQPPVKWSMDLSNFHGQVNYLFVSKDLGKTLPVDSCFGYFFERVKTTNEGMLPSHTKQENKPPTLGSFLEPFILLSKRTINPVYIDLEIIISHAAALRCCVFLKAVCICLLLCLFFCPEVSVIGYMNWFCGRISRQE